MFLSVPPEQLGPDDDDSTPDGQAPPPDEADGPEDQVS